MEDLNRRDVLKLAAAGAVATVLPASAIAEMFPQGQLIPPHAPAELLTALREHLVLRLSLFGWLSRQGCLAWHTCGSISSWSYDYSHFEGNCRHNGRILGIPEKDMDEASSTDPQADDLARWLPKEIIGNLLHEFAAPMAIWTPPSVQPILAYAQRLAKTTRPFCSDVEPPADLPTSEIPHYLVWCVSLGQSWVRWCPRAWDDAMYAHDLLRFMHNRLPIDLALACFTLGLPGNGVSLHALQACHLLWDTWQLRRDNDEHVVAQAKEEREKYLRAERQLMETGRYDSSLLHA